MVHVGLVTACCAWALTGAHSALGLSWCSVRFCVQLLVLRGGCCAGQLKRIANVMRAAGNCPIPDWMLRLGKAPTVAKQRDRDRRKRKAARCGGAEALEE